MADARLTVRREAAAGGASALPTASIVIATYTERRWKSLCVAVRKTLEQAPPPHELFVVVDHNPELLRRARAEFPNVAVVPNTHGRGDAGSANTAAALATGDVLVLLDDDAAPAPGWLGSLLKGYTDDHVLGVGGLLVPEWDSARPGWFPDEFLWVVGCSYRGLPRERSRVRNLIGANMSVRRDLFLEIGGFREDLARVGSKPFAGREAEFCIRAVRSRPDGRFVHEPAARVEHLVSADRARLSYFVRHCHDEGFAKAMLARLVGPADGLSEERSYVAKTLPAGVARGLAASLAGRRGEGVSRSLAILGGTVAAAVGYAHGRVAARPQRRSTSAPSTSGFSAVKVTEIELGSALPDVMPSTASDGRPYRRLLALVRLHGDPLGVVCHDMPELALTREELAGGIWEQLGDRINEHLAGDGAAALNALTPGGICDVPCRSRLETFHVAAPFVSVIIPTRDRPDQLRTCLESLLAGSYPADRFEVIVVDNGSETTRTADLVEELRQESIRYVREERSGSASARNAGARVARGEILAFTDDDVRVDRQWLPAIARAFSVVEDVGCVTGLILPMEIETPAQQLMEEYGGFAKGFVRRIYDLDEFRPATPTFPFSAGMLGSGQNMAFSAASFREMGGFDPALGNGTPALGGVDIEMLFRTIVEGHRLVYEPRAIVHHANYRDYRRFRRQVYMYGVGLSAFLTRSLVERPDLVPAFLRRLPSGVAYALGPKSEKHARKSHAYPRDLRVREAIGMLVGPLAYARSRRAEARRKSGPHRRGAVRRRSISGDAPLR
jgi:GT2 family glycosyltransferase